jgi:integral membrane protein
MRALNMRVPARPTNPRAVAGLSASLTRYRILAYVVGVGLLILVLVGMPLKYFAGTPAVVAIVGPLHGFLFFAYVLAAIDLSIRARFHPVKAVLVLAAGTIPFLSFVAEHNVTRDIRRGQRV